MELMTTHELFELALLDAVGLLDESESASFELAFQAAPAALQAQIRREQTRFSSMESLLPKVEPPADLRSRVIEQVRRAMASAMEEPVLQGAQMLVPPMFRSKSVARWWRTAAVASMAAALFMGGVTLYVAAEKANVRQSGTTDSMLDAISSHFGPAFVQDVLFDRDTRRLVFTPEAGAPNAGEATVFVNPEWAKGQFFCKSLEVEPGRQLRLALVDDQDRVVEVLSTFTPDGNINRHEFDWSPKITNGRLAIVTSKDGDASATSILSRADLSKPAT